jgi:hypothetical protein
MARRSSIAAFVTALAVLAAGVAGCGSSSSKSSSSSAPADNGVASKSAQEIVSATKAAADKATSVHVAGSIVSGATPITLNMDIASSRGGRGQLSENGLSFELIQVGETVYIKGSPAFYRQIGGPAAAQLLQGRWLKAPTSSADFSSISSLTNLRKLLDSALASHGPLQKRPVQTVDGQSVVGVVDTAKGGTLFVATKGQPYPIAIAKSGKEGGKVSFTRWNEPVTLTAPPNSIDITQLRGVR